jgi:hypothetical protein
VLLLGSRTDRRKGRQALWLALLLAFPALALAQAEKPVVGRLVGENLVVLGPAGETFVGAGDSKMVTSGSEVRVQSGEARLELVRGGLIRICNPAHFTVLGSGSQVTLALDSGRVEAVPSGTTRLAIYTAQIVARPVKITDEPEEFTLGVETGGAMCVRAVGGAVELEEQLTGKKLVVPQGGEILLPNGRLAGIREARGGCLCKLEMAELPSLPPASTAVASGGRAASVERAQLPPPVAATRRGTAPAPPEIAPAGGAPAAQPLENESNTQPAAPMERAQLPPPVAAPERGTAPAPPEIASAGAPAAQPLENESNAQPAAPMERAQLPPIAASRRGSAPAPPEVSSPVWKVVMPPLVFNAGAPSPPARPRPNPEVLQLVSEDSVQPALVIRGEVVPEAPQKKRGFWSKIGGFFGHLFGHRPRSRG